MSVHVTKLVFEALLPDAETKLVALRLADFANRDGASIFPSVARIANDTLLSARTVQRRLKLLVALSVLLPAPRRRGGSTNCYAFDLGALRALGSAAIVPGHEHGLAERSPTSHGNAAGASTGQAEGVSLTPNPSLNHHSTVSVTTQVSFDELQEQLIAAAGGAVDESRVRKSSLAPVMRWREHGLSLERDILPAIAAKARTLPAGKVQSWLFFDGPVREWHAQRNGDRSAPAATHGPDTFTDADWLSRLEHLRATCRWHDAWGPEPGEPACLVPPHLLTEWSPA